MKPKPRTDLSANEYWFRISKDPQSDQDHPTHIMLGQKGTYFYNSKVGGWSYVDSRPSDAKLLNRPGCDMDEQSNGCPFFQAKPHARRIIFMDKWLPRWFIYWYVNKRLSKEINTDPARQVGGEDVYK